MFLTIRKKTWVVALCIILICVCVCVYVGVKTVVVTPNISPVIVIDAGHGGLDVK